MRRIHALRSLALAALILSLTSACHSTLDLATGKDPTDSELLSASDVVNVAYTYEFPEVYRGEYELRRVAIVSSQYGREFGRAVPGDQFVSGLMRGLALGLAARQLEVALPEEAVKAFGLSVNEDAKAARGSLTNALSERKDVAEDRSKAKIRAYSNIAALDAIGQPNRIGYAPGSRAVGLMHTLDEECAAVAREIEADVIFAAAADEGRAKLQVVVPFANLKVAGGDRVYPVDFNHTKVLELYYEGISSSFADGERIGQLLARRFRLWYPGSAG